MSNLRNRLTKRAAEEFTYVATAPIKFFVIGNDSSEEDNNEGIGSFKDLKNLIDNSMRDSGPSGLAQYIHNDLEDGLINSIVVGVEGKNESVLSKTVIKATRELTAGELSKLKDFITAQFSDGWGEGINQTPIAEWKEDIETDEYDEETKEHFTDTYKESYELCAHFWYPGLDLKIEKM